MHSDTEKYCATSYCLTVLVVPLPNSCEITSGTTWLHAINQFMLRNILFYHVRSSSGCLQRMLYQFYISFPNSEGTDIFCIKLKLFTCMKGWTTFFNCSTSETFIVNQVFLAIFSLQDNGIQTYSFSCGKKNQFKHRNHSKWIGAATEDIFCQW